MALRLLAGIAATLVLGGALSFGAFLALLSMMGGTFSNSLALGAGYAAYFAGLIAAVNCGVMIALCRRRLAIWAAVFVVLAMLLVIICRLFADAPAPPQAAAAGPLAVIEPQHLQSGEPNDALSPATETDWVETYPAFAEEFWQFAELWIEEDGGTYTPEPLPQGTEEARRTEGYFQGILVPEWLESGPHPSPGQLENARIRDLRDAPAGARIGWVLAKGHGDISDSEISQADFYFWLPRTRRIYTYTFLEEPIYGWSSLRGFEISADGLWMRVTPRDISPIWMQVQDEEGAPERGPYHFRVLDVEASALSSLEILPREAQVAIVREPGEFQSAVAAYDRSDPRHGFLKPTGRVSGEWLEVVREINKGDQPNEPCLEALAKMDADTIYPGPESTVTGWIRYRSGDAALVDFNHSECGC